MSCQNTAHFSICQDIPDINQHEYTLKNTTKDAHCCGKTWQRLHIRNLWHYWSVKQGGLFDWSRIVAGSLCPSSGRLKHQHPDQITFLLPFVVLSESFTDFKRTLCTNRDILNIHQFKLPFTAIKEASLRQDDIQNVCALNKAAQYLFFLATNWP